MDQLCFVETVNCFSEGVVIGIPEASEPMVQCLLRPNARYSEWINIARPLPGSALFNNVPRGAVLVVKQTAFLNWPSIMQGLLQSIEDKISLGRS